MKELEIVNGDVLIAEFLKYEVQIPKYNIGNNTCTANIVKQGTTDISYHRSWNMLIPIYRKIKTIVDSTDWKVTSEFGYGLFKNIQKYLLSADIEWTFYYITLFIKWYNEQHKS